MKIFDNVLTEGELSFILEELSRSLKNGVWKSSQQIWGEAILQGVSGSCLISKTSDDINMMIGSRIRDKVPEFRELSTQFYVWGRNSGIASHRDGGYEFAATIYLNERWDMNNGGIFLYEDSDGWRAFGPKYNSMVVNDSRQNHMVTQVSSLTTQDRYTIQIFGV